MRDEERSKKVDQQPFLPVIKVYFWNVQIASGY